MSAQNFARAGAALHPWDAEAAEWLGKLKQGTVVQLTARVPRNPRFHRQYFKLLDLAYDYWSEAISTPGKAVMTYKGEPVLPDRERFRSDVIILAGFYRSVVNLKGEIRLEPESLKWSSMTEERFADLYSATINVLLRRVFNGRVCQWWSEDQLRSVAERILEFDT